MCSKIRGCHASIGIAVASSQGSSHSFATAIQHLLQVPESAHPEAIEEELAAGGDVEVASGLPRSYDMPAVEEAAVVEAAEAVAGAAAVGPELDAAPRQMSGSAASEAPDDAVPLQHYAGRICEGGHPRYTARMHEHLEGTPLPQVTTSR